MEKIIRLTESDLVRIVKQVISENDPKVGTGKKPKGFSQKAHCDGKRKNSEMKEGELTEKCWAGYTQKGMKTMFGKRYPNCVKKTK
jgi:hypothetical protein